MTINLNSTLEQLDKNVWTESDFVSHLVMTCHQLRKKPLKNFTVEDLRIMIGQNINLEILIPLAIKQLQRNILAEGNLYEGDLLKSVLDSDTTFWTDNRELWSTVKKLYLNNKPMFELDNSSKQIRKSFEFFETI